MAAELEAEAPGAVLLVGVNAAGLESGNALAVAGRTLALLQDTAEDGVWDSWGAAWRDVVVLDAENVPVQVYNLSVHDLNDPANYAELKTLLLGAR